MYSGTPYLLKLATSSCVKKVTARPGWPARPALPTLFPHIGICNRPKSIAELAYRKKKNVK